MRRLSILAGILVTSTSIATAQSFLTRPDIHGDHVIFTAEGDLWICGLHGGDARRLTSDPGLETQAHFSPDGTNLAFTANYDGGGEAYVMPLTGGVPKRLTYDATGVNVLGWSPDGANVMFRTYSKMYASSVETGATHELFLAPIAGGLPTKVAVPRGSFASLNHDGQRLAYVPASNEWMNWFRYEAGEADSIWLSDLKTHTFNKLTNSKGVDTQPVWVGDTIYFVSERTGVRNLYRLDPSTKAVKQITFSSTVPVRYPSSDGHRVVFEMGPNIATYDPATEKVEVLDVHLQSDHIHARPHEVPIGSIQGGDLGPTGKRVALIVQGQIVTVPADEGGLNTLLNDSSQRTVGLAWAPDGKQIAYVSDASGEEQIWLTSSDGSVAPKQLTHDLKGQHSPPVWSPDGKQMLIGDRETNIQLVDPLTGAVKQVGRGKVAGSYDGVTTDFVFSPDSKWVAYSNTVEESYQQVFLYEIATGKTTALTDPAINSSNVAFSPDGLYLYFLQQREVGMGTDPVAGQISHTYHAKLSAIPLAANTPSPFLSKNDEETDVAKKAPEVDPKNIKVDIDGIGGRLFDMKAPSGDFTGVIAEPGRVLLNSRGTLFAFDIASKSMIPLAGGINFFTLSADGKKMLVVGPGGLQVVPAMTGPFGPGQGAIKLANSTINIDPVAQWRQIFNECWRVSRDFFYDPNMHGVDWKAVKTKYAAQLPLVGDRNDLTRLLMNMVSELNTGHCYIDGPSPFVRRGSRAGSLGADLVFDGGTGAYKIKHVLRGDSWSPENHSPLADPGLNIHDGDYLLKIGHTTLSRNENPEALLVGKTGQTVIITVNSKPSLDGARTIPVVPIASDLDLRKEEWVTSRREYVNKASGGQLGYVYVPDMEPDGANEFARGYFPVTDKPGIIVDVRGNGGGFISGSLLATLATKITGYFTSRAGGNFRREGWAPVGPIVAVTNEYAFSDGEYFSEYFKRLHIGPLVGHRTGGGEVGSGGGYILVDGGDIFVPNYGAWTGNEWVIEGRGAVPDYEVDQDPASVMAGKDPQLDKAIALALEELKKHPFKPAVHPPFPVKTGGSRAGGN